jgi:hypothetical protein
MKLKFLITLLLVLAIGTFASSEECSKDAKNKITCNKDGGANVSAVKEVVTITDDSELSPLSLLIFQI